jgi:Tol biopolymer transport system component
MKLEDELARRLRRTANDFDAGPVRLEQILRRGRLRRLRRFVGVLAATVILGTAVVVPLALISGVRPSQQDVASSAAQVTNGLIAVQVLVEGHDPGPRHAVYVMDPDGSNPREIDADGAQYLKPAWSPDGQRLAVVRVERHGDRLDEAIYVMNADGTDLTRVHSTGLQVQSVLQLAWSPDGKELAFIRLDWRARDGVYHESEALMELVVMNADGTDLHPLTDGSTQVSSFSWSPDGTRIAYTAQYLVTETRFAYDLFVMKADGTGVRQLTDDGRSMHPAWSPAGDRLAFVSWEPGSQIRRGDIYVMRAEGTDRVRLTFDSGFEDRPVWAPDGTVILFARYRPHSVCELVQLSPEETADVSGPAAGPSPAPTSERVVLSSEQLGGCASDPSWQAISAA